MYAEGWHQCEKDWEEVDEGYEPAPVWRTGTLHQGVLDIDCSLWALARRLVPLEVMKKKLDIYIQEGHLDEDKKDDYVKHFEDSRMPDTVKK